MCSRSVRASAKKEKWHLIGKCFKFMKLSMGMPFGPLAEKIRPHLETNHRQNQCTTFVFEGLWKSRDSFAGGSPSRRLAVPPPLSAHVRFLWHDHHFRSSFYEYCPTNSASHACNLR